MYSYAAIIALAVAAVAAAGLYLYRMQLGKESGGLFAPKVRRLACLERAYLEGGRKLVLIRRDDVEHLILIGGPIDIVIETGIRADGSVGDAADEEEEGEFELPVHHRAEARADWRLPPLSKPGGKEPVLSGPMRPAAPEVKETVEEMLELEPQHEAKAVQ